jgi:hypothetical protein
LKSNQSLVHLNTYLGLVDEKQPRPLAFLTDTDKQMILLYLQGTKPQEIVEQLGVSISRFRRVVKSDLGQLVIDDYFKFSDQEFSTLYELAVDAVRAGLNDDDIKIRLQAADKFFKAHGKYDAAHEKENTAEDVVRRIFEMRVVEERKTEAIQDAQVIEYKGKREEKAELWESKKNTCGVSAVSKENIERS